MATNSKTAEKATKEENIGTAGGRTPYLNANSAPGIFKRAEAWMRPYFQPIDEFERIARNRPSDRIPSELPKVTDGTMSAIIQEDPKRVIQQLATGKVNSINHDDYAAIADVVHRLKLLPNYRHMGTALQKHWNMLSKARTWGRSTSYTFFTSTNGVFHTDFVIPYFKDVITEQGKVYAPDSKVSFLRSWFQQTDLDSLIAREEWMIKHRKGYKPEWDLTLLKKLRESGATAKPADLQTPAEKEKGGAADGYEIIHAFQEGIGAEFYSFSPSFESGANLRTRVNPDPRGKIPLDHEYCNIDLSNPMGRGSVEASGGVQNLIDQQMQMFQFITTLLMGPPLQVWGTDIKTNTLKFRPNAIWRMGTNSNNKVEPYQISNHAIQQFSSNYGLLKSQILNLNNSQDHSVSGADAPGQSKTQAGVQASEARLGISDNYMRKQHEAWFEAQAETSLNIYFAEMTAPEKIQLKGNDLKAILKTPAKKYVDAKGVLTVPHNEIKKVSFSFQVDASSSEVKEQIDNAEKLTQVLALIQKSPNPDVQKMEPEITKVLIKEIGAEGIEDIIGTEEENAEGAGPKPAQDPMAIMQQMMPQIQQMTMQMIQEAMAQKQEKEKEDPTLQLIKALGLKYEQLPQQARQIVLEQTGFGADGEDPIETKHDLEKLAALNQADDHERGPELQREQQQAQLAATANSQPKEEVTSQTAGPAESAMNAAFSPEEQQVVEALIEAQFTDDDIEQAITMMRQGMPIQQIMDVLRSKYAAA